MSLINRFKIKMKDWVHEWNVLFPKVPEYTQDMIKARKREVVSYVGGFCDGENLLYQKRYATEEDIQKKREKLRL